MEENLRMGYLAFGVAKPGRWTRFCETMLGLPPPLANGDGSLGWRIDDTAQRLVVRQDPRDDLVAIGVDCIAPARLDRHVQRLRCAGLPVIEGDGRLRRARRVERLFLVQDPAGNTIELFCGAERADTPFRCDAFPGGFRSGDLGFGHAALIAHDLAAMEDFYVGALGFRVTERLDTRVGPIRVAGVFLHCNARHHSLALLDVPSRKRIHHFMLQANDHMDVGRAFERTREAGVALSLDIGQHPDPDGTFSFYASTPSGFDFEIGAGGKEIDPRAWQQTKTSSTSAWGHRPQWRMQWRTARDLLANTLWG